jgi:hypothetical protein
MTYNKLAMQMGGKSWREGSQEIIKSITTTQLKLENAYIFFNVMDTF